MTSIVTMTTHDDHIQQTVTNEDPADLYVKLERFVSNGELKCYSLLTLKSHNS